jgi:hypothetical protein
MEILKPEDLLVVFRAGDAQIRSAKAGPMTVTFCRLPAGAGGRPLLRDCLARAAIARTGAM